MKALAFLEITHIQYHSVQWGGGGVGRASSCVVRCLNHNILLKVKKRGGRVSKQDLKTCHSQQAVLEINQLVNLQ